MSDVKAVGFGAIVDEFTRVYNKKETLHYGTLISWELGGNDPLDGISIYETDEYYHFVTFGLSDLYEKTNEDEESGYGWEFTFKLKKYDGLDFEIESKSLAALLNQIARITFTKGVAFTPNEFIYTGQKDGIDSKQTSNITGFILINDPSVNTLNTPNGTVEFVELIGVTYDEIESVKDNQISVQELYEKLSNDLTDYSRKNNVI